MFKWIKKMFQSKEVAVQEMTEEKVQEEPAQEENEDKELSAEEVFNKLNDQMLAILSDYVKFQQKLLSDTFVEIWKEKYYEMYRPETINRAWAELAPKAHDLFEHYREADEKRNIKDICIEICEEKFKEMNERIEVSIKRIAIEDITKRIQESIEKISGPLNVQDFAVKVLNAIDAIEEGQEVVKQAAATVEDDKDEFVEAIDSFVTSVSQMPPFLETKEEAREEIESENSEPNVYLTDDERRFIELSDLYPDYAPAVIFNMIHKEKEKHC